ncbi:1-(5-phosphoribosyl)-5-[(5-phosphoribosylamino)methylideneamino]imidazole-4-carboxamide isomerase [Bacillus testis]|uniref:1-(5-phosphoribosyl)-5-[(5- phosphoribosylamino)methylideneamino]imidazole-4- carboxamide isomerase n=1 Tax=Bacillus testis TaxID=1622072 RepID=UPI00067F13E7|nr:1-(5-phosphoribosyl)-5-[(5-phosphoribosylamino)methylideneamino]imidazole-4-carboxamide isomerase [Bacillus testis]
MNNFTLYPAIDLRGGKCVRLLQGDYNEETIYGDSPYEMAKSFSEQGAQWIHMVDLDGARAGHPVNHDHVIEVAERLPLSVQVGGGLRTKEDVALYLEAGVERVILGSVAVTNPLFAKEMLALYPGRIVIGIDAKDGRAATHGWLQTSSASAVELAQAMVEYGADTFIFTDIATDGTLTGPNVQATRELAQATGASVIASGGISSLADISQLASLQSAGVTGSIVGKALYSGRFSISEALACVKEESQ